VWREKKTTTTISLSEFLQSFHMRSCFWGFEGLWWARER